MFTWSRVMTLEWGGVGLGRRHLIVQGGETPDAGAKVKEDHPKFGKLQKVSCVIGQGPKRQNAKNVTELIFFHCVYTYK